MDDLRCDGCGRLLGQRRDDGTVRQRHRGRETDAVQVIRVRCEACGTDTRFAPRPATVRRGGTEVEQR